MSNEMAKRHIELIRRKQDEAATVRKAQIVRNDILSAKTPKLFADLEKSAQEWVSQINSEFKSEPDKALEYISGTGIEVPRFGFKIRRSHYPQAFVTVLLDDKAHIITIKTEQKSSFHGYNAEKEDVVTLTLDDKDNVIIGMVKRSSQPPVKILTLDELLELIVSPIVEALSE
jgi:hypothetical protein